MTRPPAMARPHTNRGKTLAAFRPLPAQRSLSHALIERLTSDITAGNLAPGSRLPTEQEMNAPTAVRRTGGRRGVAAARAPLRGGGVVVPRQGVGAFVAAAPRRPFRIEGGELRSLREVIEVMEL